MKINANEIGNNAVRDLVEMQMREGSCGDFEIQYIFRHRYENGNCDWGYSIGGKSYAYYGNDSEQDLREESEIFAIYDFSEVWEA